MTAITLGIFGVLFLIAFMQGMTEQRLEAALKTEVSHIQIHEKKYLEDYDFNLYMDNVSSIEKSLKDDDRVKSYSKRILINSLATTAEAGTGITIVGVDPQNEKEVTDVYQKLTQGAYFEGIKRNPIVIGEKLAEKLKAKVRSKVVLHLQDTSGATFPSSFRVAGIYKTSNTNFDKMHVFARNSDLMRLTGLTENEAHEIAIVLNDRLLIEEVDEKLGKEFPRVLVETWVEGNVILAYMSDAMTQYMAIMLIIILFALFFGITNTMMMAILERKKEIAMLKAIGMSSRKVFRMIMLETVFLSVTGAFIGILLGFLCNSYFSTHGLNLTLWSKGLEAVGYDPIVYFQLSFGYLVFTVVMVILTGIVSSFLPAWKALRMNPCEALRME
ncbi:MAG: ABC transporter permease [Bacteroidales bacterium]|nr:ABC transporter permease [Bacteroidales bacterium]